MTEAQSSVGLAIGNVVAGRYRVEAILGDGGMGVVYRVEHLHLRKPFALKALLPQWVSSPEVVARFEREAIAAGNIASPHIAAATDFGRLPDGTFFLVMEYIDGHTLRSALDAGALDPARALRVARGITSGLYAAHLGGVVHRDMKPENIMLVERDGDPDFVKLLDFGIAKLESALAQSPAAAGPLTRMGAVMGTPDYMSPEQAIGQPVDARTDQYALGVILFEMLTGGLPFEGDAGVVLQQRLSGPPPQLPEWVAERVDPRVGSLLSRLLAPAPENRFATTTDLLAAIDECERPARVAASAPSLPDLPAARTTPFVVRVGRALSAARVGLRREKRSVLLGGALTIALVAVLATLAAGSRAPAADAPVTDAGSVPVATPRPAPTRQEVEPGSVADLPPPPAPSSSSGPPPPSGSHGRSRRTGPGGIYIPPPSRWFK